MTLTAWQEQQNFESKRAALIAQGARVGRSVHKVFTKGRGDVRVAQPVTFALTFCEEPIFTAGLALGGGQPLVEHLYPLATVGVYKWQRDSRGMYVGAYLWVSVTAGINTQFAGDAYLTERMLEQERKMTVPGSTSWTLAMTEIAKAKAEIQANQYSLEHHLVFEALAIRDINYDQMMAD